MTHHSVPNVTPTGEDWIEGYLPVANRLIARHGGKYLARTADHERLEGEGEEVALRICIEWPSKETAKAFENDPDYQPYLQGWLDNSISQHFLIASKDDLA